MRTVLITGSSRGIGLELARQLRDRGDAVIAACRRPTPALEALGVRVEAGVDVSDGGAVAALASRLEGVDLDWLINNAGILRRNTLGSVDYDSALRQLQVNALGPLRVTEALLPKLSPGSKVAIVTSRMGSIADNSSGSHYGYRMSKAAANMAGVSLARDLAPRKIAVCLLHPGYVATDMTGGKGEVSPAVAAAGLISRIDELRLATSGSFWHADGRVLPW